MRNKISSFAKIFGFVALVLCVYFFFLPFAPLLIAGVIGQGILGKVSGKVGPVVGGDWKGINYLRGYVIPANPNTVDQQTQRTRFTVIQDYVRQVLATLVHPYWNQYAVGMSGFNAITSDWMLTADANNLLTANSKMAKGTLASQLIDSAEMDELTGVCDFSWTYSLVGNQLATDTPVMVLFDKVSGELFVDATASPRSGGTSGITIGAGHLAANMIAYLFFEQGSGSSKIVSDSDSSTVSAI